MLNYDESSQKIRNSEAFVDIATAEKHRGMSTIYIERNLFCQSKLGREVELQHTHSVNFKSHRHVMQVSTLHAQLGLESDVAQSYRDAISVSYDQFIIGLSPRTDDRLRYCTNTGSIPSIFYIPDQLKQSKILDDEHTKSLYSPSVPIIFPPKQNSFPSFLTRSVYQVPLQMYSKPSQKKTAKHKRTSHDIISKTISVVLSGKNHLNGKKRRSGIRRRVRTHKSLCSSLH